MVDAENLIEEVRKFPVLYDQSSEKYRNVEYKEKVWNINCDKLGSRRCPKFYVLEIFFIFDVDFNKI
jgi:hypothetical protein